MTQNGHLATKYEVRNSFDQNTGPKFRSLPLIYKPWQLVNLDGKTNKAAIDVTLKI